MIIHPSSTPLEPPASTQHFPPHATLLLPWQVCTTLGMLTPEQAEQLRTAGLTAYNHNLDTSPEYYGRITTTRRYEDRLATLEAVRAAGISVCAGGCDVVGARTHHQHATLPCPALHCLVLL
jgi:biotin synthase